MNHRITVKSVRSQVYEQVREMIISGVWEPGARVDLNQIATGFGVSKTPLNEAIQILIQEGLLTVKPRSGTYVSAMNVDEIDKAFEFRLALEVGAAEAIVGNASSTLMTSLKIIDDKMRDVLSKDAPKRRRKFLTLDGEFHDLIIAASGNQMIIDYYRQVNSLSNVSRARRKFTAEEYKAALEDHNAILAALEAVDIAAFRRGCATHVENAKVKMRSALDRADK